MSNTASPRTTSKARPPARATAQAAEEQSRIGAEDDADVEVSASNRILNNYRAARGVKGGN